MSYIYSPPAEGFVAPILHESPDTDPTRQPHIVLHEIGRGPSLSVDFRPEPRIDALQRYGRDAARIPTEGNRPGTPPSPDLVALNNLGNEAVRVEGEAMAIAVRFWERHDVEAAFYGASEAPSFGFRVDPGFLVIAGIARAQDTLRLNSLQEPFTVTRQHFVQATTRVLMQRARLMVGPITDSDLN